MEMQEIIGKAEQDIRQALKDYGAHTSQTEVLDAVSERFIRRLARDSSYAKQGLRGLFSRSPVWNEKIGTLVINGTRTHDPDYERILGLGCDILQDYDEQPKGGQPRRDLDELPLVQLHGVQVQ